MYLTMTELWQDYTAGLASKSLKEKSADHEWRKANSDFTSRVSLRRSTVCFGVRMGI